MKKIKFVFFGIILFALSITGCQSNINHSLIMNNEKKQEIEKIFIGVLTNEEQYSDQIATLMERDVYNSINVSKNYSNFDKIKAQINKNKWIQKEGKFFLYYNVDIEVLKNITVIKTVEAIPIVLTVELKDKSFKILEKQEYVSEEDVPKDLK